MASLIASACSRGPRPRRGRVQNHVAELWAILHFLAPRKFDDADGFLAAFGALSAGGGTVQQVRSGFSEWAPHQPLMIS